MTVLVRIYNQRRLNPIERPDKEVINHVSLPVGGRYGVGGMYLRGTVLGPTGVAKRSEIRTIAVTGSPTGFKLTITFTGGRRPITVVTANLVTTVPTEAQMTTALEEIFGTGNVLVVLTGQSYAITFRNILANREIGGLLVVTGAFTAGTAPAVTHTRTQKGSVGPGQFDTYDDSTVAVATCVNVYDAAIDEFGGVATENAASGQPGSVPASFGGVYRVGDLVGLDANAVTDLGRFIFGNSVADPEAWIAIQC